MSNQTFFGSPNLPDLGPCRLYVGTEGLTPGTKEFKEKYIGKTSSVTVRPARFTYVDFVSSEDGAEAYDRAISGQGANVEASIVTPSSEILARLIPGFETVKDKDGNVTDSYLRKIIGTRLSDFETELVAIRNKDGMESKDRRDMILFKRVWPSIETIEAVFDAATPREISSLIYEAQSFEHTLSDNSVKEVYWSFMPESRLDTVSPGEVTNLTGTKGSGEVTLNWTNPTDIDLSRILISWSPGDGSHTIRGVRASSTTSYIVTGLTGSTEYTFTIQTQDTNGNVSQGVTVKVIPD